MSDLREPDDVTKIFCWGENRIQKRLPFHEMYPINSRTDVMFLGMGCAEYAVRANSGCAESEN